VEIYKTKTYEMGKRLLVLGFVVVVDIVGVTAADIDIDRVVDV
jgi:hypothetical protein